MQHRTILRRAATAALAAAALSACGLGSSEPTAQPSASAPAATADNEPQTAPASSVQVVDSPFGQILTDARGMTLYAFDKDKDIKPQSACNDNCALTWPPAVAEGDVTGEGIDAALLSTSDRADGGKQITANSWPLYTFSGDQEPGDTSGQGSGDVWHVVGADGKPIRNADVTFGGAGAESPPAGGSGSGGGYSY